MFGLTGGELFIVVFILVTVVSAPWWPRLGEGIAAVLTGDRSPPPESSPDPEDDSEG